MSENGLSAVGEKPVTEFTLGFVTAVNPEDANHPYFGASIDGMVNVLNHGTIVKIGPSFNCLFNNRNELFTQSKDIAHLNSQDFNSSYFLGMKMMVGTERGWGSVFGSLNFGMAIELFQKNRSGDLRAYQNAILDDLYSRFDEYDEEYYIILDDLASVTEHYHNENHRELLPSVAFGLTYVAPQLSFLIGVEGEVNLLQHVTSRSKILVKLGYNF